MSTFQQKEPISEPSPIVYFSEVGVLVDPRTGHPFGSYYCPACHEILKRKTKTDTVHTEIYYTCSTCGRTVALDVIERARSFFPYLL